MKVPQAATMGQGPGEYSGFQVTGMIRGFFWGLKFSISGCFWGRKFIKYFFGWPNLSRDFFGYTQQSEESW